MTVKGVVGASQHDASHLRGSMAQAFEASDKKTARRPKTERNVYSLAYLTHRGKLFAGVRHGPPEAGAVEHSIDARAHALALLNLLQDALVALLLDRLQAETRACRMSSRRTSSNAELKAPQGAPLATGSLTILARSASVSLLCGMRFLNRALTNGLLFLLLFFSLIFSWSFTLDARLTALRSTEGCADAPVRGAGAGSATRTDTRHCNALETSKHYQVLTLSSQP